MAGLSPSSNISYPTTPDPQQRSSRQQQQQQDDQDDDDNNNNNDEHEHDVPGQRISSPDYVEVEIPQSIGGVAPSQRSPVSSSSEGYPSWLPKRPPPPAPGSTLHSLSTAMMFGSDGPAEQQHPGGGAGGGGGPASGEGDRHPQTPVPFSGGRKPTPRSVRIVSMQDSNAATSAAGGAGVGGAGSSRRELGTDRTRVSSNAGVTTTTTTPPRTSSSFFCSLLSWSRGAGGSGARKASMGGRSPTLFSSSQTPDARLRVAIASPPKFRSPGLHLELLRDPSFKTRMHFYLWPIIILAHVPLQTFLDFNAIYILIE